MRKKNYKLLAGTLVVALIMGSLPTNVSADTKSVNKIVTSKNKTTTVVKTISEFKNALKNKSIKKVELKTDKKVRFNLSGNNKGVKLVINAPKAEIKNTGKFIWDREKMQRYRRNRHIIMIRNLDLWI